MGDRERDGCREEAWTNVREIVRGGGEKGGGDRRTSVQLVCCYRWNVVAVKQLVGTAGNETKGVEG